MLVNHNINNLSGGISRQPDEARFDNQVEDMVNFVPHITGSITKRNGLEYIRGSMTYDYTSPHNMYVHSYDRGDGLEKYGIIMNKYGIFVYDENGNQKSVTVGAINPLTIWNSNTPNLVYDKDIQMLTVGDTTWILNKKVIVQQGIDTSDVTTRNPLTFGFYWINRSFDNGSGSGYTYQVVLNGTTYTSNKTTSIGAIRDLTKTITGATTTITEDGTYTGNGWEIKCVGSVMKINTTNYDEFTFQSGDSYGNQASVAWRNSVAKITDLPSKLDGFTKDEVGVISVTGTDRDEFTSYYLKWDGEKYVESCEGGYFKTLDPYTLPAKLVRQSDGTFKLGFNMVSTGDGFIDSWESRRKGDDDSNPIPSFVGSTISSMFFFRNRLCFTSEENVVMSEVGEYYNFFATTVIEILDSDPIDVAIDSDTVSLIRNVNAVAGSITLWSDNGQFVLSGGDILSPSTTRISKTSSYNCDNRLPPLVVDNEILFFNTIGNNIEVLTYSASSLNTDKSSAESITTNIIGYIPNTIQRAVVAPASNMVFLLDYYSNKTIYVYKYHVRGTEKIMSSWFKWTFPYIINSIEILSNTLYVMYNNSLLGKIDLDIKDINQTTYRDFSGEYSSTLYDAEVVMSKFNIETQQGTRIIREPFYMKNIKVNTEGYVDLNIINDERGTIKTIDSKHIDRKLFVGGNTDKIRIGFKSSSVSGCEIKTISIEGLLKTRSRNV